PTGGQQIAGFALTNLNPPNTFAPGVADLGFAFDTIPNFSATYFDAGAGVETIGLAPTVFDSATGADSVAFLSVVYTDTGTGT
ncbi:hypothetical protein, partial [Escherichia coli]|uniref:hypothetical protein n=1 Tax=Escherichia coli TaxID=562 RepID=UPI003F44BD50